ncbi:hypothetical protein MHEC_45190 [Mycobacterium heckeshornense]|uniref:Uncharacterized protein n=1 Tax=Mycobacterium heckeshornense TaxID=110505 RepID=A0A7R7GY92_9MYCO|nr:hypothetical protein MHEC_45190 [Mycobacterium heckeshornense]
MPRGRTFKDLYKQGSASEVAVLRVCDAHIKICLHEACSVLVWRYRYDLKSPNVEIYDEIEQIVREGIT